MIKIFTKTKQLTLLFMCLSALMLSYNVKAQNCTVLFAASINNYDVSFAPDSFINNAEVIWNYGDGSPADTTLFGNHTYSVADTFVVCLTINDTANLCTSTICDSIIVLPPSCNSIFTYSNGFFLAEGQNGGTGSEQFIWNYGDGSPADTGISVGHTYAIPGTYYVCLTTNDSSISCSSVVCDSVTILPPNCDATFTYNNNFFIAQSTSGNGNLNFIWDFGDGSPADSSQFTPHTYAAAGSYIVCLTSIDSSSNCTSNFCDTVVIDPFCTSTFNYNNGNFNAQNTGGSNNPMTYFWDFGDSSAADTGQFVPHQFPQAGTYYVCLTAVDSIANCTSNFCDSVVVLPTCNSTFTYNSGFFIAQNNGGGNGINYMWDFGDSTSGTGQFAQHAFTTTGTYLVCLTATDSATNCVSVYCDSVIITVVGCDASFTYADGSGSVAFSGATTATGFIITYAWDFGDGTTGNGQNPTHNYTIVGTYTVCVTATDVLSGCADSVCQTITIITATTSPCETSFSYSDDGLGSFTFSGVTTATGFFINYTWDFGDLGTDNVQSPTHVYTSAGDYIVCFTVNDVLAQCTDSVCQTVSVSFTGVPKLAIDEASVIMAPNPVKDNLMLAYTLNNNAKVSVEIYDILGKGILNITQANQAFGQHNNTINLSNIAAGSYILKLNVDGHIINKKLIKE